MRALNQEKKQTPRANQLINFQCLTSFVDVRIAAARISVLLLMRGFIFLKEEITDTGTVAKQ